MEVAGRLAFVVLADVRQANDDPVNRFVRQVFGVVEAFGDKDPDESSADGLVFRARQLSIIT